MYQAVIISGTGGQGIVLAGELLSEALFSAGYEVVNTRSYGSEARGGSCRSEVIVSDEEIYDLQLEEADILIALSEQAYRRFIGRIRRNGLVLVDVEVLRGLGESESRDDIKLIPVAAGETAEELGNPIVANMVLLGALLKRTELLRLDELRKALEGMMPPTMQEINLRALEAGYASI